MANAGTADMTIGTVSYWSDDQLQTVLDRYRTDYVDRPLYPVFETQPAGTLHAYRYISGAQNLEATDGGTAVFVVKDMAFNPSGTANWTPDYPRGEVTFIADTLGHSYHLTGRAYNLNKAAADVWRTKASYYSVSSIDWSTDNMSVKRSQVVKQAYDMAAYYDQQAGPESIDIYRGDMDAC
jgi:hypothetical protein